jgi:hypothetical protein
MLKKPLLFWHHLCDGMVCGMVCVAMGRCLWYFAMRVSVCEKGVNGNAERTSCAECDHKDWYALLCALIRIH